MRHRILGRTGIRVSEIGFGAWGIGGDAAGSVAYGPADRRESVAALRRAAELGVNFVDTADFYGFGRSEELIGEAFAGRRAEVVIASKVGMLDGGRQDFSPAHIRASIAGSLARLGTDYVDLYQLHSPPPGALLDAAGPLRELQSLRDAGRVRAVGVSVRAPEDGLAAARHPAVDCIQVNFSLVDQRARASGLLKLCAARGVGIIGRTPLCFGFLTGKYGAAQEYAASDHRARWSVAQRERWASGAETFARWRGSRAETPTQFALRFCLSYPALSTTIPGMLLAAHAEENAAAGDLGPLSAEALRGIEALYGQQEFFVRGQAEERTT